MMNIDERKIFSQGFEKIIFCILLFFAVFSVWRLPVFITMDGPAHLYNASLLNIHNKSTFLQNFLNQNHLFVPNYLAHWILQKLLLFFNQFVAEKLLVSLIVVALPVSFRLAVKTITKSTPIYSFLIFPLVFTSLLQLGFYNFCLGFVFFNIHVYLVAGAIGKHKNVLYVCLLLANGFMLYYCHLFGYAIAVFTCVLFILKLNLENKNAVIKNLGPFIAAHIPTLIFACIFAGRTQVTFFDYDLEPYEKSLGLVSFSPGIVFEKKEELPYSILISILLIAHIANILTRRSTTTKKTNASDTFLLLSAAVIYLIFHSKDGDMTGLFSQRLFLLAFYFLIIWVACNGGKNNIVLATMAVTIFVCWNLWSYRNKAMAGMQKHVEDVGMAAPYIREKTVVHTINLSEMPYDKHLSDYLGINKEVLLLENYAADLPWFPLVGNVRMHELKKEVSDHNFTHVDYLFVYGADPQEKQKLNEDFANDNMVTLYESGDGFCGLYGRRN